MAHELKVGDYVWFYERNINKKSIESNNEVIFSKIDEIIKDKINDKIKFKKNFLFYKENNKMIEYEYKYNSRYLFFSKIE